MRPRKTHSWLQIIFGNHDSAPHDGDSLQHLILQPRNTVRTVPYSFGGISFSLQTAVLPLSQGTYKSRASIILSL